jgi:HEAT repeat protein
MLQAAVRPAAVPAAPGPAIAAFIAGRSAKDDAMTAVPERRPLRWMLCCALCASMWTCPQAVARLQAGDAQQVDGVDVIQTVRDIKQAVSGPHSSVARGKPWEDDIAALTDPRPEYHGPAIAALIRRGTVVLEDLMVLAGDQDWQIRGRVVQTAAGIGGDGGTALILSLTDDADKHVRELCATGLGMAGGKGAFDRLVQLLHVGDPTIREAAARGLATLGDARGLEILCAYAREPDDVVQRQMRSGLAQLAMRITSIPAFCNLLRSRQGDELIALIDASFLIGDPRLCLPLSAVLAGADEHAAQYAARSLGANGDSRALGPLCIAAGSGRSTALRENAAETLRMLTGYGAAAGSAWTLWWHEHQPAVESLAKRDEFIAELHDPHHLPTRSELTAFTVDELAPLVDGALETGQGWWAARSFMVLASDARERWTNPLLERIASTREPNRRLALIIILDQLGDPAAAAGFKTLLERDRTGDAAKKLSAGPERIALAIALERRGVVTP